MRLNMYSYYRFYGRKEKRLYYKYKKNKNICLKRELNKLNDNLGSNILGVVKDPISGIELVKVFYPEKSPILKTKWVIKDGNKVKFENDNTRYVGVFFNIDTSEGYELNKQLESACKEINKYKSYTNWLIEELGIFSMGSGYVHGKKAITKATRIKRKNGRLETYIALPLKENIYKKINSEILKEKEIVEISESEYLNYVG